MRSTIDNLKYPLFVFCLMICSSNLIAQDAFVTKPYLQIGYHSSAQTLQLLWHAADADADWVVEYTNGSNNTFIQSETISFTKVAVSNTPAHRVYHASFKNLVPGKRFSYHVIKAGTTVFSAEAQAPKSADQSYRFVAMGDIGAETRDQKKLATQAYLLKPDFVAIPGDIVYEYGLISEYRKKFWPVYNADKADTSGAPIMRSIPFIAAVGNHDADSRDLDKTPDALAYYMYWEQPLNGPAGKEGGPLVPVLKGSDTNKKAFYEAAGDAYPRMTNFSFNYGNAHWTVLDADTYVDWTDKELTDWVAKDLADAKDAVWHFVMFHHPGFNSSIDHYEQQQMRLLSPIFEAGKVDVVFNGHVHNYQRSFPMTFKPEKKGTVLVGGKDNKTIRGRVVPGAWKLDKAFDGKTNTSPKGIIYVITGAGGQELYNPEQTNDPDSWQRFTKTFIATVHSLTVADVNGKTLTIRQVDTNGKEIDSFTITK
ncbi:MAG: metallophosphoesterase [Bacteroidota bacterium]